MSLAVRGWRGVAGNGCCSCNVGGGGLERGGFKRLKSKASTFVFVMGLESVLD